MLFSIIFKPTGKSNNFKNRSSRIINSRDKKIKNYSIRNLVSGHISGRPRHIERYNVDIDTCDIMELYCMWYKKNFLEATLWDLQYSTALADLSCRIGEIIEEAMRGIGYDSSTGILTLNNEEIGKIDYYKFLCDDILTDSIPYIIDEKIKDLVYNEFSNVARLDDISHNAYITRRMHLRIRMFLKMSLLSMKIEEISMARYKHIVDLINNNKGEIDIPEKTILRIEKYEQYLDIMTDCLSYNYFIEFKDVHRI